MEIPKRTDVVKNCSIIPPEKRALGFSGRPPITSEALLGTRQEARREKYHKRRVCQSIFLIQNCILDATSNLRKTVSIEIQFNPGAEYFTLKAATGLLRWLCTEREQDAKHFVKAVWFS